MSKGTWTTSSPQTEKIRSGMYNRFTSLAKARIDATQKGVAGIPVRADWGPLNELTMCADENEITKMFGKGQTVNLAIRMMKGGKRYKPRKVLVYRMGTADAEKAVATVDESIKFCAKYPGTRGNDFRIAITASAADKGMVNVTMYEGSTAMRKYTVAPSDIVGLVNEINSDKDSLITAEKIGDTALAENASIAFSGGNSGEKVTADNYVKALNAFEGAYINTLSLDGVTDEATISLLKSWHSRVWDAGKLIQIVIGGTAANDADPALGNARSKGCDNYGIINPIVGVVDGSGNRYCSAETAPQIAGAIAALPLNQSLTYKELEDVYDVTVALSDTEITDATRAGSLVLMRDVDPEDFSVTIKVESGINTFTGFTETKGKKLRKIKAISTMAAIDYDTGKYAMKNVVGELDNDDDGRAALISGISKYLETLADDKVVSKDILVNLSETVQSEDDYVFMNTQALTTDKIERIFNDINL